ncbi:MAG: ROK family protein [Actinomycetota bacterium]|nr:ROK family protein [Actinomycetota bacterium]
MSTIGIDIGGSKALAVRLDDGIVADERHTATQRAPLVDVALAAIRGVWIDDVEAVGVGIAGLVQWPEGVFAWGPHVDGTDVPLKALLEEELGIPVAVDNDANVAAFGERVAGAARGFNDFLLITLGTGIGGAIVIDGSVYRGESFAGEWGHIRHDPGGLLCDCGKRGCWETVASGPALVRLAREVMSLNPEGSLAGRFGSRAITGEDVTAAADAGDEVARGLVAEVGSELGHGLANLIAIFDPELVIVGGGLGSVGESLLGPARRVAAEALHGGNHRLLPPILVAGAGPRAGAIGAAYLASAIRS